MTQIISLAVIAFEELQKKYPKIMNSLNFAQIMAESRKRKAQADKSPFPPPPKVIGALLSVRLV